MQEIQTLLNNYIVYIVLGLILFSIIVLIMLIINTKKITKIRTKYEKFMQKEDVDLENLLIHYAKKVNTLQETQDNLLKTIEEMQRQANFCVQKVGVVRYNAIERVGADLSFAIAFLDYRNNGVVINGIYSRDGSYTYAKPIEDGKSTYTLSDEEIQAIEKAKNNITKR